MKKITLLMMLLVASIGLNAQTLIKEYTFDSGLEDWVGQNDDITVTHNTTEKAMQFTATKFKAAKSTKILVDGLGDYNITINAKSAAVANLEVIAKINNVNVTLGTVEVKTDYDDLSIDFAIGKDVLEITNLLLKVKTKNNLYTVNNIIITKKAVSGNIFNYKHCRRRRNYIYSCKTRVRNY